MFFQNTARRFREEIQKLVQENSESEARKKDFEQQVQVENENLRIMENRLETVSRV
jgi:hypothetical protein